MIKALENDNKTDGSLPIGWEIAQAKDVCDIIRGVSYKKADSIQEAQKGYLPILRATNIQDNSLVLDKDLVYVPSNQVSENQRLKIGDIVIATSSGSKHLVGKTAQVKEKWYGAFGAFCAAIRSTVEIDYRYLGYFFNSPAYKDVIAAKAIGVNINNLRRGDIEELKIPLAPLNEQKRIVAEIEKQFSRLDEAVSNLKRVKANLKRYKASVLKAAVEGKPTEAWRKKHPDVEPADKLLDRILVERRKKWEQSELAKMKVKGKMPKDDKWKRKYKKPPQVDVTLLPVLPYGWSWANFGRLAENTPNALKAGPFGSSLKKSFYVSHGYKIYGQEQVLRNDHKYGDYYINEERYKKLKNCSVKPGDILISLVGTIGKVLILPDEIEPGIINPRLVKFSLDRRVVDASYIKIYLQSPYVKYLFSIASHGGTMDILNLTILKEIPIPLPPLEEQKEIVEELERVSSIEIQFNSVIDANDKRAYHLRQSILKKAFSGKIM